MITVVVFDFDGTLVDSNQIKIEMLYEIVRANSGTDEILEEILADFPGADRCVLFRELASRINDQSELIEDRALKMVEQYTIGCEERIIACNEIPGAESILRSLGEQGIASYLCSATPLRTLCHIVEERGWGNYFAGIFGRPETKKQNLGAIIQRSRTNPKNIVVIGDGEDDRVAAVFCGCNFIGFNTCKPNIYNRLDRRVRWTLDDLCALPIMIKEIEKSAKQKRILRKANDD